MTMSPDLLDHFTPEEIHYGQAVSICSAIIDMGLQRACFDDIVDGLNQRFEGMIEKNIIIHNTENAIALGVDCGLFEPHDEDYYTLTDRGHSAGREWLKFIRNS